MTATLSTRLDIRHYDGECELSVDYEYSPRSRTLLIHNCFADINGTEVDCWNHLTQRQRYEIEERCVADYTDRMMQVAEDKFRSMEFG